jgi:CBS-domain-containing membrane protein
MKTRLTNLPGKMKGQLVMDHEPLSWKYAIWGFFCGTLAIFIILKITDIAGQPLFIGSFGASAVLLFGATESPLAQPRNLVGGHLVSALVAVVIVACGGTGIPAISLAVGISLFCMYLTRTVHPPGGATALIGVQGHAGVVFLFVPILAGCLILLLTALVVNNLVHHRQYPKYWL